LAEVPLPRAFNSTITINEDYTINTITIIITTINTITIIITYCFKM